MATISSDIAGVALSPRSSAMQSIGIRVEMASVVIRMAGTRKSTRKYKKFQLASVIRAYAR